MFILKKIMNYGFDCKKKIHLLKYEQILSDRKVLVVVDSIHVTPWFTSNYIIIKRDRRLFNNFVLSECNYSFDKRTNTVKVGYMETAYWKRGKGYQQLLQAVMYDYHNAEMVIFNDVRPKGKKYIKNSKLFENIETINESDNYFDLKCVINKEICRRLLSIE